MLGQQWQVIPTSRPSADRDLRLVEVAVGLDGQRPMVTLRGFVDDSAQATAR